MARISVKNLIGKGYNKYWNTKKFYKVVKGSRGSKKSVTTQIEIIAKMMAYPWMNVIAARRYANTLRDSVFVGLKSATHKLGVTDLWEFTVSPMQATYKPTGQKILFRGFDDALKMTLKTINFAEEKAAIPYAVFKPTGVGRIELYEKVGLKQNLSDLETAEWKRTVARFEKICKTAFEKDVMLLIDAEESWMQDAADDLCEEMMRQYNKQKAIIYNTAQFYRWDRLEYLKKLHVKAKAEGFHIGMKVVRGAYMEKENLRAQERGYKSPICVSKQATDENYDAGVKYMMDNLDCMALFAGTHNEDSAYSLMQMMQSYNLDKTDNRIWFGQLYGMSDNMSYNLSKHGYNIAKYLPFGPVKEVVPYLIRRAEENTSVAGQTTRELNLIVTERNRRRNN